MSSEYPNSQGYGPGPGAGFGGAMPGGAPVGVPYPAAAPAGAGRNKKQKGSGSEKGPTKRSVSTMRWLFLGFSAVLSLLVVLVLTSNSSVTYVARLNKDMPALVNVGRDDIDVIAVRDKAAIEPNAFTGSSEKDVRDQVEQFSDGKWLSQPGYTGQQLRSTLLVASGELSTPLAPDERLISVSARASRAVAGTIRVGDRIDVYVSGREGLTGVLGQNVEVVAISIQPDSFESVAAQQINEPEKNLGDFVPVDPVPGTYVLRIRAADVAKYLAADTAGQLHLALRGTDAVDEAVPLPADLIEAICGVGPAVQSGPCQRVAGDLIAP
jgi:Flp pilus assembly protein CpaB